MRAQLTKPAVPAPAMGPGAPARAPAALAGVSNRALARHAKQMLARYDTGEHALFGTDRVVFERGGVKVTESDMITMGDLYDRVEDMYQADPAELQRLVDLIRQDRRHYRGEKGVASIPNATWEKATPVGAHRKRSFLDLA